MRVRNLSLLSFLTGLLVVGACSGDESAAPTPGPADYLQFCEAWASQNCNTGASCGCLEGTLEDCTAYAARYCHSVFDFRMDQGGVTYDAAQAGVCLAEVQAIATDCYREGARLWPRPCESVFAGRVAEGGTCTIGWELVCQAWLTCLEGECVRPGLGFPCDPRSSVACIEPYVCSLAGECVPRDPPVVGDSCATGQPACGQDLYCDDAETCRALPGDGEPCTTVELGSCAEAYYCGPDVTCVPKTPLGEPCSAATSCEGAGHCEGDVCVLGPNREVCAW